VGHQEITFLALAAIMGTALTTSCVAIARALANRNRGGSSDELAAHEERLTRVEQAVEALTVDSNRLIDGQRYLSQLLTERSAASQPVGRIDHA
jgi:hypothetical protein